jgi:3-hydroxybutyryl-CoA dehydrogenase
MEVRMQEVEHVTVVGAGTMGRGIAAAAARAGYEVVLYDLTEALVAQALSSINTGLESSLAAGRTTAAAIAAVWNRIRGCAEQQQALESADLVIEAIPEDIDLKRSVWKGLVRHIPEDALLASNTSSLSITELGEASGRGDRFLGMHFFNPVDRMPLLELVRAPATSEEALETARSVGERLGKTIIVVKDSPGFVTSRLGVALGLEAIRMLEEGVAGAADIDLAMESGYRHPMGPLKLTDLVGLDVRLAIAEHLHNALGSEVFRPPELLRRMVAEGRLGRKSGRGFYEWDQPR